MIGTAGFSVILDIFQKGRVKNEKVETACDYAEKRDMGFEFNQSFQSMCV